MPQSKKNYIALYVSLYVACFANAMSTKTVLPIILDILSDSVDIPTIKKHSCPPLHGILGLDQKSQNKILQRVGLDILCMVCKIGKKTLRVETSSKYYLRMVQLKPLKEQREPYTEKRE